MICSEKILEISLIRYSKEHNRNKPQLAALQIQRKCSGNYVTIFSDTFFLQHALVAIDFYLNVKLQLFNSKTFISFRVEFLLLATTSTHLNNPPILASYLYAHLEIGRGYMRDHAYQAHDGLAVTRQIFHHTLVVQRSWF